METPLEINLNDFKGLRIFREIVYCYYIFLTLQVNIKVQFTKSTAFAYQIFTFLVRISAKFPSMFKFSKLIIMFNDSNYDTIIENESRMFLARCYCCLLCYIFIITEVNAYYENANTSSQRPKPQDGIILEKDRPKIFELSLTGKEKVDLACTSVALVLGSGNGCVTLKKAIAIPEKETSVDHTTHHNLLRSDVSFSHILRMDGREPGQERKKFIEKPTIEYVFPLLLCFFMTYYCS